MFIKVNIKTIHSVYIPFGFYAEAVNVNVSLQLNFFDKCAVYCVYFETANSVTSIVKESVQNAIKIVLIFEIKTFLAISLFKRIFKPMIF